MAGFSVFELPDGRFRAVAQLPGRKPKYIERKTKQAAEKAMRTWLVEYGRLNPSTARITVAECLDAFLERCRRMGRAEKTLEDYERHAGHLKGLIGSVPIVKLTVLDVERCLGEKPRMANARREFLRAAINAIGRRLDPSLPNPAERAETPTYTAKGARALTDAEYQRILKAEQDPKLKAFWRVQAEAGYGPKEANRLTRVERKKDGAWISLEVAKNEERKKPVPILNDLADELEKALPFAHGETYYRDKFKSVCKLAEVEGVTQYSLRHYFANVYRKKVDKSILKRLMRHTDIRTTERHYIDVESEELREALKN